MESAPKRVTVAVLRGTLDYKVDLKQKVQNIKKKSDKKINLERLIELGINLALEGYGEKPLRNRLIGRYKEK